MTNMTKMTKLTENEIKQPNNPLGYQWSKEINVIGKNYI